MLYRNNRDLFIEVSHGPYIVDHNILASDYALDNYAQGGAYLHNLICGKMVLKKVLERSTPYHLPHTTEIKGFSVVQAGDDRFMNNVFIGTGKPDERISPFFEAGVAMTGTGHFDQYLTSLEEYIGQGDEKPGDVERFLEIEQPVYIEHNVYDQQAVRFKKEETGVTFDQSAHVEIDDSGDGVDIIITLPEGFENGKVPVVSTDQLERTRISDAEFESPSGEAIVLNRDFNGTTASDSRLPGPFEGVTSGKQTIRVSI